MSDELKFLRLGDTAPDFDAESSQGPLNLYKYHEGSWLILFSHPGDYTPVCTTELGATAKLLPEFEKRNTKVAAISVDTVEDHHGTSFLFFTIEYPQFLTDTIYVTTGWIKDIEETQTCKVTYPIIADPDRKISNLYGMLAPKCVLNPTIL